MIDLHCHILVGLDDGPATLEESRELARAAVTEGVTTIAATPHVRNDYPTSPEQMEAGVAALRADFAEKGIEIEVVHGGEIALDSLPLLSDEARHRFSIAQSGRYVLLESPYLGWPLALRTILFELQLQGIAPILAHPERNPEVQRSPERLRELVEAGLVVQITAASLDGRLGKEAERTAHALLDLRCVHVLASDAHHPSVREVGMERAIEALDDEELSQYLTVVAPMAVVAGEPVPPPPELKKQHRWFRIGKG